MPHWPDKKETIWHVQVNEETIHINIFFAVVGIERYTHNKQAKNDEQKTNI